jgi:hypothetical protein
MTSVLQPPPLTCDLPLTTGQDLLVNFQCQDVAGNAVDFPDDITVTLSIEMWRLGTVLARGVVNGANAVCFVSHQTVDQLDDGTLWSCKVTAPGSVGTPDTINLVPVNGTTKRFDGAGSDSSTPVAIPIVIGPGGQPSVLVPTPGAPGHDGAPGATGATGPANTLTPGTVVGGDTAAATITGVAPNQVLNLVLPKGDQGGQGVKGDTGTQGPAGGQGEQGVPGVSLDIEDTVPTYADLAALTPNNGDAYVVAADGLLYFFDGTSFPADGDGVPFVGPQGPAGGQGVQGDEGPQGVKGDTGEQGPPGTTDWSDLTGLPSTFPPAIGSGAAQAVAGNDSRLSDTRTPTAGSVTSASIADGVIVDADINAAAAIALSKLAITGTPDGTKVLKDNGSWGAVSASAGNGFGTAAAAESTASTSYTSLATTTDQCAVTVGPNKAVLVLVAANLSAATVNPSTINVGIKVSGANTVAAADARSLPISNSAAFTTVQHDWFIFTPADLSSTGATTFALQFKASAGTMGVSKRSIIAIPL